MKSSNPSAQSMLPKQSAPIQRPSTSAAISSGQGVETSGIFDIFRMFRPM